MRNLPVVLFAILLHACNLTFDTNNEESDQKPNPTNDQTQDDGSDKDSAIGDGTDGGAIQQPEPGLSNYAYIETRGRVEQPWKLEPTALVDNLAGYTQDLSVELSKYGGVLNTQYEATGHFYTKKVNGRWWFVDPEGHLALMPGVNGLTHKGRNDGTSPYQNDAQWAEATFAKLQSIGIYGGSKAPANSRVKMNYTDRAFFLGPFDNWLVSSGLITQAELDLAPNIHSIFHPDYPAFVERVVTNELVKNNDDPHFIGFLDGIELYFSPFILSECLQVDPANFNHDYAVQWVQEFRGNNDPVTVDSITQEEADEFYRHYLDRHYGSVAAARDKHMPNKLYMGSRIAHGRLKDSQVFMETYGKYVDVMSFNNFGYHPWDKETVERFKSWTDTPWWISAYYTKFYDIDYLDGGSGAGDYVRTWQDRGHFYQNMALSWIESGHNLGWFWIPYDKFFEMPNHEPNPDMGPLVQQVNRQYLRLAEYFDRADYEHTTSTTLFAHFRADKQEVFAGDSIAFTDQTTGSPDSWQWTFQGGWPTTSSEQNPTVIYSQPGVYKVSLSVSSSFDSDSMVKESYITVMDPNVNQPPKISINKRFALEQLYEGEDIKIGVNVSDPDGTIQSVEFVVDGESIRTDSAEPFVKNTWIVPLGTTEIITIATDDQGAKTTSEPWTVVGRPLLGLTADFNVNRSQVRLGETVMFNDLSAGYPTSWSWTFDGGVADDTAAMHPRVTYNTPGVYSVSLTVSDGQAQDSTTKTGYITVGSTSNSLPSVSLTAPADGASFAGGSQVGISASASDSDGQIERVEFFVNSSAIRIVEEPPYRVNNWVVEAGEVVVEAVAVDNDGGRSSTFVTVTGTP